MKAGRSTEPSALSVTVRVADGLVTAFLTDGRSVGRHGVGPVAPDPLGSLVARPAGPSPLDAAGRAALYRQLLPGPVGEYLRRSPARPVNLLVDDTLDAVPWEALGADDDRLGLRHSLSRYLAAADEETEAAEAPAGAAEPVARLRVLRVSADVAPGGWHPAAGPASTPGPIDWQALSPAGLGTAGLLAALEHHDVVLLDFPGAPAVLHDGLGSVAPRGDRRRLRLLVLVGEDPAAPQWEPVRRRALHRQLTALGIASLEATCDAGSGAATRDAALDVLVARLAEGQRIGEAVRSARAALASPDAAATLRLYGPADVAIVQPEPRAGPTAGDDLRQVTAISFDLVDSTRWLQRLGGERYAELLASFHDRCTAIVRRHGGSCDDPQGDDGLMAYFGYPLAIEKAAERAVAAALEITEAVATLNLLVRCGVATGRVAVKAGTPVGVSIHLAARLQSAATPGTVLVADSTHALVAHRFELAPRAEPLALKGIEGPQPVFQAVRDRSLQADDAVPAQTPFVGREAELATLTDLWAVARSGQARVALVTGEAGIGKSRLVREFRRLLTRHGTEALQCHCQPDSSASAYHALTEALRRHLRLADGDDAEHQLQAIERGLPAGMSAPQAVPVLASLLTVPYEARYPRLGGTPDILRQRIQATLLDWFRCQSQGRPMCLVFEDIQWIDPSTRELLGLLLGHAATLPMLVLFTLRSDPNPPWWPELVHETLDLKGLAPAAARWMVQQACGDGALPTPLVNLLAARADGVPLFLEESARMAVELGRHADPAAAAPLEVPATLQDLLMARLDRLGPAKAVAQVAAVLGREFPAALLDSVLASEAAPVLAGDPLALLDSLERSGLVAAQGRIGDRRYAFKHALVRDIAYQSLWERDRRRLHHGVASVLQTRYPELTARQPELLAHHQTEAGLHAQALAQWEVAARRAASRSAHDESISHLLRALDLLDDLQDDAQRDATELRLQLLLASRCIATDGYGAERVERVYLRAAQLCDRIGDPGARLKVELGLQGVHLMRADFGSALDLARRAQGLAERAGDAMSQLQALWAEGMALWHQGDLPAAVELMDRCLEHYHPRLHRPGAVQDPGVMCLCYSAWGQWELGRPDEALRRIERVLELARELDHKFSLGEAYGFAACVHHFRGETDAALDWADRAVAVCEDGGFPVWLAHGHLIRGRLRCERGRLQDGMAEMREGYAMWLATGAVVTRPLYLTFQAEGLALAGDPDAAMPLLEQALQTARQNGERYHEAEVRRMIGETCLLRGHRRGEDGSAEAEHWLLGAHDLARHQRKASFALRSAIGLARLWSQQGRDREAAQLLAQALADVPEGRDTRDPAEARRLLHGLGGVPVDAMGALR
jgi:class 3 adenylate cyclase/tetratricopeptide (TPR) repeat protein